MGPTMSRESPTMSSTAGLPRGSREWRKRRIVRQSPGDYATLVGKGAFRLPRHLRLLNRKLLDVARGRIDRLIISMPPRHGKSDLTSKFFPAWYLGLFRMPST